MRKVRWPGQNSGQSQINDYASSFAPQRVTGFPAMESTNRDEEEMKMFSGDGEEAPRTRAAGLDHHLAKTE